MISAGEALGGFTQGCKLVLLAATQLEADPVRRRLNEAKCVQIAGKQVHAGDLRYGARDELRAVLGVSGCDKVNAATLLTGLLQAMSPAPELVLQFGIGGAFAEAENSAGVGDLVVATQEAYSDTGSSSPRGWLSAADLDLPIAELDGVESGGVFPMDPDLVEWATQKLQEASQLLTKSGLRAPAVLAGPCVTSSLVTGTDEEARLIFERWGCLAESMEGAAAAHVCALHGVPFLELRGISNLVGHRTRQSWQAEEAAAVAGRAAVVLADEFASRWED